MDIGYVVLLLLGLVYCSTAVFLYLRARQEKPGPTPDEPPEALPEEPRTPEAKPDET